MIKNNRYINNIITMKKVRSTGKVGKPSFFDRIKMDSKENRTQKQNIDINHIRESSYKLTRSKSHRKGHSLERKVPIISTRNTENTQQGCTLQEFKFDQNVGPGQFTVKMDQYLKESKGRVNEEISQERKGSLGKSFKELFSILQISKKKDAISEHFQSKNELQMNLEEEQQILELIKGMWQAAIKIKDSQYFKEESMQIQQILKTVVLKLAKPKLQFLEEQSNFSLKVPSYKYSSPGNIVSIRQEPNENSFDIHNNTFDKHNSMSSQYKCPSVALKTEECPGEQLEFKKIMYILEESHKISCKEKERQKEMLMESGSRTVVDRIKDRKTHRQSNYFHEGDTKPMLKNNKSQSYFSSFNNSETTRNHQVVYEQEKMISKNDNNKLFLKNIVKKVKSKPVQDETIKQKMKTEGPEPTFNHSNTFSSRSLNSSIQLSKTPEQPKQYLCSITSEPIEQSKQQDEYSLSNVEQCDQTEKTLKSHQLASQQQIPQLFNNESHSSSVTSECISTIQQVSSIQTGSESKRATLNNIINMLNTKYNKKINFQPPK